MQTPSGDICLKFLVDTGSQISLINYKSIKSTLLNFEPCNNLKALGFHKKFDGYQTKCKLELPGPEVIEVSFFALPDLTIASEVEGITKLLNRFKEEYKLSEACPEYSNDVLHLDGILGTDAVGKISNLNFASVAGGKCLKLADGFVPFGVISSFELKVSNFKNVNGERAQTQTLDSSRDTICLSNRFNVLDDFHVDNKSSLTPNKGFSKGESKQSGKSKIKKSKCNISNNDVLFNNFNRAINFVLKEDRIKSFSPVLVNTENTEEQLVESGIERMFSLESIGIPKAFSCSDTATIKDFDENITLRNGKYHVKLPWKEELVSKLENNFEVAKAIAVSVANKNSKEGHLEEYLEVFDELEKLGIVEALSGNELNSGNRCWIPHRPIVRTDPLVKTTKIRPVFNCSLKTGGSPSLNEVAFPGVDLLNPLLGLLQHFRTNQYVLLADLKKAFLNIFLSSSEDKAKFSFITFDGKNFKYYQFNTILFGYVASPFILNYVLRHHSQYAESEFLKQTLNKKFYVDNMVVTSNSKEKLSQLAGEIENSLSSVGIAMQEWITNDVQLTEITKAEMCLSKVLGYKYDPTNDEMSFKIRCLNTSANTNRSVMSSAASIFDPLGLINPLMLSVKLFIRKLHLSKLGYDEEFGSGLRSEWLSLCLKFNSSEELKFSRFAYSEGKIDLIVFCDASKEAYGTAVYVVKDGHSSLIFSKVKLAPFPVKTLPTLELLAVYLGFCNVKTLIEDDNFQSEVENVTLVTDSQVALSWLIKGRATKKNVFVNNRLSEIEAMKSELSKTKTNVSFRFVPSAANLADKVTRVTSYSKFKEEWELWLNGPSWLVREVRHWPTGNLGSIPVTDENSEVIWPRVGPQGLVVGNINIEYPRILEPERYSSFGKLWRVTNYVRKFVSKLKRENCSESDMKSESYLFLLKMMQRECFPRELDILNNKTKGNSSDLIERYSLFLDDKGLIRADSRLSNVTHFTFSTAKPVLLGNHHVSKLLLRQSHYEVNHMGIESTLTHHRNRGFLQLSSVL